MDLSPLWALVLLAGSLLLPPGVAGSVVRVALDVADDVNARPARDAWTLLRSEALPAAESGRDGQASSDSPAARLREGSAAPAARPAHVRGKALGGTSARALGLLERAGGASLRDAQAVEALCTEAPAVTGIDLVLRFVVQQLGAPVTQVLDEYQAYRAGWQGRD